MKSRTPLENASIGLDLASSLGGLTQSAMNIAKPMDTSTDPWTTTKSLTSDQQATDPIVDPWSRKYSLMRIGK